MSKTEESANLAANDEASGEPTVSTAPPSVDESAEAADVADDALQNPSAGVHAAVSVGAASSEIPAADSSSNEHQNASTEPAGQNLMIEFLAFLNEIDVSQPSGTKQDPSNELESYLEKTKLYGDNELSIEFLSIQDKLKVFLSPGVVKKIYNLEGKKAMYDFIKRNNSFFNEDFAKTTAIKAHNYVLESLILNKLEKFDPEVVNQVNDQYEKFKLDLVEEYKNGIESIKQANFSQNTNSTGGAIETTDDSPSESSGTQADVCETVENLNEEEHGSGTSKDDPVGRDASSQSDSNKSDEKDDSEDADL